MKDIEELEYGSVIIPYPAEIPVFPQFIPVSEFNQTEFPVRIEFQGRDEQVLIVLEIIGAVPASPVNIAEYDQL